MRLRYVLALAAAVVIGLWFFAGYVLQQIAPDREVWLMPSATFAPEEEKVWFGQPDADDGRVFATIVAPERDSVGYLVAKFSWNPSSNAATVAEGPWYRFDGETFREVPAGEGDVRYADGIFYGGSIAANVLPQKIRTVTQEDWAKASRGTEFGGYEAGVR